MNITMTKLIYDKVNAIVCQYYNVNVKMIYNKSRFYKDSKARSFILYILHKFYSVPIRYLSIEYNRKPRDIYYNCAQISNYIKLYPEYKKEYDDIIAMIQDNK